jgi:hypothetical protein
VEEHEHFRFANDIESTPELHAKPKDEMEPMLVDHI